MNNIPHFQIKRKFQKDTRGYDYRDMITDEVLKDISYKISGQKNYTCTFDEEGYNKGRLAIVNYADEKIYISFSEIEIGSRNSSFQSLTTALIKYHLEEDSNKRIFFYFLPQITGSFETDYFKFMYRLMKTAGVEFLNESSFLENTIDAFTSIEDLVVHKNLIRGRNRSNNSTYITRSSENILQIYGKTYGANKYETSLLCIAISFVTTLDIELYQITEQNLTILPGPALQVIENIGRITIITTDLIMEKREFSENNSLRSPRYIYNLLSKLGNKKCSLCGCEIPELIQGAHILPVADIKRNPSLSFDEKFESAIDSENGIWLCQNHHKLFDTNILVFDNEARLKYDASLDENSQDFINKTTFQNELPENIVTPRFLEYLDSRNLSIDDTNYIYM